ncbi:MAG: hypothetical protein M1134_02205 [Actinobacteria bacterium]|jgi:F-type H+-transporting ATPase subunit epsilon|nr:hypothetical protein [Actinomycetota bacterium]
MAAGIFLLDVVTPESTLFSHDVRSIVLRSSDGELTVLDGHTPLVTDVTAGTVKVATDEDETLRLAVHGGYIRVDTGHGVNLDPLERPTRDALLKNATGAKSPDVKPADAKPADDSIATRVTLLASAAEFGDEIDVERARRAKEAAEELVEALKATVAAAGSTSVAVGSSGSSAGDSGSSGADLGSSADPGSTLSAMTPEQLELADAQAALRRAEVRLDAAGAD